jgi:hypothetical protein
MWIERVTRAALAAIVVSVSTAAIVPSVALAEPHHGPRIEVRRCEPVRNVTTTPTFGYVPGYYPRSRYFWDDVYGFPYYQRPVTVNETGTLKIDYVNVTHQVMQSIDFGLVANGKLVAEVRDVGTFSPQAEIKHTFGLDPNVFPLGTALPQCVPLRITYPNAPTWVNPHLPALRRGIYAQP